MVADRSELLVTAGSVNDSWNYQFNPNGFYRFDGGFWTNVNLYSNPVLDTVLDLVAVARDYGRQKVYLGSYGGGLLEYGADGAMKIFKQGTGLQAATGDPNSYRVAGLAMDGDGDLWIANYGAPQDLVLKKSDGSWASFPIPFSHSENAVSQMIFDDAGHLWIVSPKGNGLFCYDPGADHASSGDDRWRFLRQGVGNGNLPSSDVRCVARDGDGFIWVGTAKGIGIFTCLDGIFDNNGCEAYLPVVVQDGVPGYLFHGDEVRTIAVDGANRKWIGTRKGAWLISADGEKTIAHFTEANSPLLSNDVNHIAIDPSTGEVFFSTFNGICSFRGTATVADSTARGVLVFPNPVPPGYGGTIVIRGLPENAWVRITELDGRLVYQSRSLGGQAVWDGRNYKGEKVSSAAYLVLASDANNQSKVVAKVFFVR
jgi:ligand-binding sensor domain-containing protein